MTNSQHLDFSFYLSLFCCLHLWLLCLFLVLKKQKRFPDFLLATFLFGFSAIHIQHLLLQVGYISYVPFLDPIMGVVLSTLGPLFYFYVRSLTGENQLFKKMKPHIIVLVPALVHFFYLLFTKSGAQLHEYYYRSDDLATRYTLINLMLLMGMLGYFLFYLVASIKVLNRHATRIRESYSNIEKIQLGWLKDLIIALMIFACVIAPVSILIADTHFSQLAVAYFSTFIYFIIVYKSLNYSTVFSGGLMPEPIRVQGQDQTNAISLEIQQAERYTKSSLSSNQVEEYGHSVEIFLVSNNLLYDQTLSLKQMAEALKLSPHVLSEVINRYYNKSFFDVVNSFRVEEAKKQLKQIEQLNYTIEGIGYSCGFGSKTTFYRAFKKHAGLTPSEFNALKPAKGR
ncbi:helix-turn-helix domain-containing protein [Pedobacter heparinus]|uniref:helix-turn-helix domain-containing protein n=1 Tax=Pedobacter heparinus TaxID=984 RepID=UPI002930B94A|nr:helix-turn-helix domain-containing protein [Pedobacter heparinus]